MVPFTTLAAGASLAPARSRSLARGSPAQGEPAPEPGLHDIIGARRFSRSGICCDSTSCRRRSVMPGRASTRARCTNAGALTTSVASQSRSRLDSEQQRHVEHGDPRRRGGARPRKRPLSCGQADGGSRSSRRTAHPEHLRAQRRGRRPRRGPRRSCRRAPQAPRRPCPEAGAPPHGTAPARPCGAAAGRPWSCTMPIDPVRPTTFMAARARIGARRASPAGARTRPGSRHGLMQQHAEPVHRRVPASARRGEQRVPGAHRRYR